MVTIVAIIVWRFPWYLVLPVSLVFMLWDGMFLSSALLKVPNGAWFTLMIAAALLSIFITWRFGKEEQWRSEKSDNIPLSETLQLQGESIALQSQFGGCSLTQTSGMGIFFDKSGLPGVTPAVFLHFIQKFQATPAVTVFFHLRPLTIPTVAPSERYTVTRCLTYGEGSNKKPIPNCYRLLIRHGYADQIITPDLGILVLDSIRNFLQAENSSKAALTTCPELEILERAFKQQVIYIVGSEQLRIKEGTNIVRRFLLGTFLWLRDLSRTKVQNLNVQRDKLVEVGFIKDI